jgi:hypothetical protein
MWGLRELPLPEPVEWWPATPGWLVVAALVTALAAWIGWRSWLAWQRGRYRREALVRLGRIANGRAGLTELPGLLRRTALAAFPREEVAALRGPDWVVWLNSHGGRFEASDAAWLDRLPYDPEAGRRLDPAAVERLVSASRRWVRAHRAVV